MRNGAWMLGAWVVGSFAVIGGCGGAAAFPPEVESLPGAPVEGIRYWAQPGDLDAFLSNRSAPRPSKTVDVSTTEELLKALGDDTLIRLAPGRYVFDDSNLLGHRDDARDWSTLSEHYQSGAVRGVKNLVLAAATNEPTLILQPDSYAAVLHFEDVENVGLFGLTLGHRPDLGFCRGDVLHVVHATGIEVANTTLFGSGTKGLTAIDVDGLRLRDSVITDSSEGFGDISRSRGVRLERVVVAGNNADLLRGFTIYDSEVTLDGVTMKDNRALEHKRDPDQAYGLLFSVGDFDPGGWFDVKEPYRVPERKGTDLKLSAVTVDGASVFWPPGAKPVGHCAADETARFSCPVTKGKTASVCERTGRWAYRFGPVGSPELTLPSEESPFSPEHATTKTGEDSARYDVVFRTETHSYTVEVERTEDQFDGVVKVRKGNDLISTVSCRGAVQGDFTGW